MNTLNDLKWNERYTWIWLYPDAVLNWTDEDFDREARAMRDNEITTAIIMHTLHFTFSFVPWLDDIVKCVSKLVQACHRYGIKVVEHNSTCLTYVPETDADWDEIDNHLRLLGSSVDSFLPGLREALTSDPVIEGTRVSSWYQISGATGKPIRTHYVGYTMCYNNPDYRRAYFSYLRRLFATGIDGIMNDDIQYYPGSCTCEHCRKLFKEQTGYEIPDPEHWDGFYNNFDDPAYVAFLKFRQDSTNRYYDDIVALEKECGVHMLRPNYISGILNGNWSAYPFEKISKYLSCIFQENDNPSIIRYCFPLYMIEAVHRYSLAAHSSVPSMSMFYALREDECHLSWALAHTWGQIYSTCTVSGVRSTIEYEKKYRLFEQTHSDLYRDPKKLPDLAIYMSIATRDFTSYAISDKVKPWISWTQASCLSGLQTDMIFDFDDLETLKKQKMIVLPDITMLSDKEIAQLHEYAAGGGKLVIVGKCGILDEFGKARPFENVRASLGETNVTYLEHNAAHDRFYLGPHSNRRVKGAPKRVMYDPEPVIHLKNTIGKTLRSLLPQTPAVTVSENYLAGLFSVGEKYTLNLTSIKGLLPAEPTEVGHDDPIPGFAPSDRIDEDVAVTCNLPTEISRVTLWSPSVDSSVEIPFSTNGTEVSFTIPEGSFGGYALIEMC